MSYSSLVSYVKISPNRHSPRNKPIDAIAIHHMAGDFTLQAVGEAFALKSRRASSNYAIDSEGRIACFVEEGDRSWCTSSSAVDHRAVTIEVANCSAAPDWRVSDKAYAALLELCEDICRRYGFSLRYTGDKKGNLFMHKWYASTLCPGPYLGSKFPEIATEVNRRLGLEDYRPTVREWQRAAMADGFLFPEWGDDGVWGPECERVAAAAVVKKRLFYRYRNLTRLVQTVVGVEADGLCGSRTDMAIRAWQLAHDLKADGAVGILSWKTMLGVGG